MRILFTLLFLFFVTACSHPLEIIGEGDIRSDSGKHDCLLENQPCANHVTGDYFETYSGVPRPGWIFAGWQGCGIQYPQCNLNVPASVVDQNWFKKMPALRALFTPELEPGVPGVRVGSVRGNTVNFGSAATFAISLNTQPTDDVTVSITSTDETEGLPEVSEFTFTPGNWSQGQMVVVRGQNGAPDDHLQDYHIVFDPTLSIDPTYDGRHTAPVAMNGLSLSLFNPAFPIMVVPGIGLHQTLDFQYSGYDALSFELVESPPGMTLDATRGSLDWMPEEVAQNRSFTVTARATDGVVQDEITFAVGVLEPELLEALNTESSITVSSPESNLNGLVVAARVPEPTTSFSDLELGSIQITNVPPIPSWITPISDVLLFPRMIEDDLEIRYPIPLLSHSFITLPAACHHPDQVCLVG